MLFLAGRKYVAVTWPCEGCSNDTESDTGGEFWHRKEDDVIQ